MIEQIKGQLAKKTRRKLITSLINTPLADLKSDLEKYYRNTLFCSHVLIQAQKTLKSSYCNSRTCLTCNAIRTAKYINYYGNQILDFKDPQFLTLTAPTVWCLDNQSLRYEIELRQKTWRKITDNAGYNKIILKGVKSLEVVPRPDNYYHPHFHIILEGLKNAEWIKAQWLNHFPNAEPYLQKIVPVKNKSGLLEVFKYGTKFISERNEKQINGTFKKVSFKVEPQITDLIIQALRGKRIIQTFGGIKRIKDDDVNELVTSISYDELEDVEEQIWRWFEGFDWVNITSGEVFSGYKISENLKSVFS